MPKIGLNAAKVQLQAKIYDAFNKILLATADSSNTNESVNPSILLDDLSKDLTEAIHSYATQANVVLTSATTSTNFPFPVVAPLGNTTAGPVISNLVGGTGQGELQ